MGKKKFFESTEEMQRDLDLYLAHYNTKRPHQGLNMNGKTPECMFTKSLKKKSKSETEKEVKPGAYMQHQAEEGVR